MDKNTTYAVIFTTSITVFFILYLYSSISIVLLTIVDFFKINNIVKNSFFLIYSLSMAIFFIFPEIFSKKFKIEKFLFNGFIIFLLSFMLLGLFNSSIFLTGHYTIEYIFATFTFILGVVIIVKLFYKIVKSSIVIRNLKSFLFYLGFKYDNNHISFLVIMSNSIINKISEGNVVL